MVPVCHAAQMSSQVWKTFHVCHLVIITSQETTTTMSSKNSGCNSPLFSLSIIYFSYKNVRKCKRKKTLIVISQREDFGFLCSWICSDAPVKTVVPSSRLRDISKIRPFLSNQNLIKVINVLVCSRLDSCNALCYNVSQSSLHRPQLVRNAAARFLWLVRGNLITSLWFFKPRFTRFT